jgi:hypothetical protein
MIVLWGALAFLQMTMLPGLLIQRLCRIRAGLLERLIYLLPLSLIANYLVIFLLTSVKIYRRFSLVAMIALELAVLLWVYRSTLKVSFRQAVSAIRDHIQIELTPLCPQSLTEEATLIRFCLFLITGIGALSAITWAVHVWSLNFGTIFQGWDTLFSWNNYALQWAENRLPEITGAYPQLVPANWSISYVLTGNQQIQLFNTLLPPLFFLWIFLMLFDLGLQKKETGFFIAAIIARYMMKKLMGDHIFDGYMDVPAASMVLLSIYAFLKGLGREPVQQRQTIVLGLVFASAAAVTKQSGIIALILAPFILFTWLQLGAGTISKKKWLGIAFLSAVIVLPWYLFTSLSHSAARGNVAIGIAEGIVEFNRRYEWSHKFLLARQAFGKYWIILVISLLGLPLVKKEYRWIFLASSIPVVIVWGAFFPYDARNLAVALPGLAILSGLAIARTLDLLIGGFFKGQLAEIPHFWGWLMLLAGVISFLIMSFPDEKLIAMQAEQQRELFGRELNQELLYGVFGDEHTGEDILTDYPAPFLSGYESCCVTTNFQNPNSLDILKDATSIRYLLIPQSESNLPGPVYQRLTEWKESGNCVEIGCSSGYYIPYCLYEIKPGS